MTISEPGYVYIYPDLGRDKLFQMKMEIPWKSFPEKFQDRFDDFSVNLTGTDIVQKDDYYPFGGSFNAYTDLSTPQQDYMYNGMRLNKTTQLYETAFRTYESKCLLCHLQWLTN
jgi:hypothetical protein